MSATAASEMVPVPATGRVYHGHRRVRLGDVTTSGRLRLDALARYLQDVSNDDTRDAALPDGWAWVVRRTAVEVRRAPKLDDELDLATFCSGVGGRWAERRVAITGPGGVAIDASTLWVHLDPISGRPRPLSDDFHRIFTATAQGRKVSAKLVHPDPPSADAPSSEAPSSDAPPADARSEHPPSEDPPSEDSPSADQGAPGVVIRPWVQRAVDLDVVGHVNNAVSWALIEEVLAGRDDVDTPLRAEVEFRRPVEAARPGDPPVSLVHREHAEGLDLWLVGPDGPLTTAIVRPLEP